MRLGVTDIEGGFPHSEISGSKPVRGSPDLIAAYHVLHRLSAPRHPPDTLKALDRSHYRCPPLGSGSNIQPCRRMFAGIEKRPFASNTSGNVAVKQTSTAGFARPWQIMAAATGCVSSSRCQIPRKTAVQPSETLLSGRTEPLGGKTTGDHLSRHAKPAQSKRIWWSQTGSNRRPHACKARALPTELWPLRSE
jgi:hypothetical protein